MEAFEQNFAHLLQSYAVPGAAVAIARDGKLLYARGFGWADLKSDQPVKPNSLFRIASISKSLTAVAVLKLCEDGKLALDQKAFALFSDLKPCRLLPVGYNETKDGLSKQRYYDRRIDEITIRQLLNLTAGWNRVASGDPVIGPHLYESAQCSNTLRPEALSIIRYQMGRRLDFAPGTQYAYGNFAYVVLGEIIARQAHKPYAAYVRENILQPLGITGMLPGRTFSTRPGEVTYYGYPGEEKNGSVFPLKSGALPGEYGGSFALEAAQASIGWLSTAVDLLRFVTGLSGDRKLASPILTPESFKIMLTLPLPESSYMRGEYPGEFFAMGWEIDPRNNIAGGKVTFSRHGSLEGTMSYVVRRSDGMAWSILLNSRPQDYMLLRRKANLAIAKAIEQKKDWTGLDQFTLYR